MDKCPKFSSLYSEENEIVRLFDELLPWTYNCQTLIDAARNGQTIECEQLIRLGVDINECDHYGNTPLWTSYFHAHLETLFTLLELGANPNTRSGDVLCSDLHRACSYGDRTLVEILIECGGNVDLPDGNGKTPLIYALEYPSTNDLIIYLIQCGANVNCQDRHGLTPLHYACYRGDYQIMKYLLDHHADISKENAIGYNILRYALSCLSYTSPRECIQYENRLNIVHLLIEQYPIDRSLHRAILGDNLVRVHLYPLFDFLSYSLVEQRQDFEEFAWKLFLEIPRSQDLQIILQNTFIFNYHFSQVIYLSQRLLIGDCLSLFISYLDRVTCDGQPNRFSLLLYLIYVDQGLTLLENLDDCFRMSLNTSRRNLLVKYLRQSREKPEKLKFYCRRLIRQTLPLPIHCQLNAVNLHSHLKMYILLSELHFLTF